MLVLQGSEAVVGEDEGAKIKLMAEQARAIHYRLCAPIKGFWECLLHVSTFATTRVALPTGVKPG
jgi:hypothetical protein